jgi:di/tricarboxylate transporter
VLDLFALCCKPALAGSWASVALIITIPVFCLGVCAANNYSRMCNAGLVLQPIPVGAWAFVMLTFTVATKTLPFLTAFAAFQNEVIWLIVVSFFFAKGFEKCGLGERIANLFVKVMGKSTLGLAYGLTLAEGLIAPAMPSTSARAGVHVD